MAVIMHHENILVKCYSQMMHHFSIGAFSMSQSAAQILRSARKKLQLNQIDFATRIGKSQGTLSRYESGRVPPPSGVIMHCMNILDSDPASDSIDELKGKIDRLAGDRHSKLREALNVLLDGYLSTH